MRNLPWFGLGIGLLLALFTIVVNPLGANPPTAIPVLAILFATEMGLVLCLTGVVISVREQLTGNFSLKALMTIIGNGLLLAYFASFGMNLWMSIN